MGIFYDRLYSSTSVELQSNMFKPFSIDHLPDAKSKSTLIPWDTEVIMLIFLMRVKKIFYDQFLLSKI